MKPIAYLLIAVSLAACGSSRGDSGSNDSPQDTDQVQIEYMQWIQEGEEALPEIQKALASDQWRYRSHALLAMGKTGRKDMAPLIRGYLADPSRAVRNCAVIALGDLKDAAAVQEMVPLLKKDVPRDRSVDIRYLLESLGKIGTAGVVEPLVEAMINSRGAIRIAAMNALLQTEQTQASYLLLKRKDQIAAVKARGETARILGEIPVPGGEAYCIDLLLNGDHSEKRPATVALGMMKSKKASLHLVRQLKTFNRVLMEPTVEALISIDDPRAIAPLISLFSSPQEPVYMSAAMVLALMTHDSIGPLVYARFLKGNDTNAPAAYVLGRRRYTEALPEIRRRLANQDIQGQDQLARSLGWMDDKASADLLLKVAKRSSLKGSAGAIWSLGQLRSEEAVPDLIALLKKGDRSLRPVLVDALGEIGDKRAVKPLVELLYSTGKTHASGVGTALGRIGGEDVVSFIKDNLEDDDEARQVAAGIAMGVMADTSMMEYVVERLDSDNAVVRRYVMRYLRAVTKEEWQTVEQWKAWLESRH